MVEFEESVKKNTAKKYENNTKFGKNVITRKGMPVFIWYFKYISTKVFGIVSYS